MPSQQVQFPFNAVPASRTVCGLPEEQVDHHTVYYVISFISHAKHTQVQSRTKGTRHKAKTHHYPGIWLKTRPSDGPRCNNTVLTVHG
jgi:hypothetical protein